MSTDCDIKAIGTPTNCTEAGDIEALIGSSTLSYQVIKSGYVSAGADFLLVPTTFDNSMPLIHDTGKLVGTSDYGWRKYEIPLTVESYSAPTDTQDQITFRVFKFNKLMSGCDLGYFLNGATLQSDSTVQLKVNSVYTKFEWWMHNSTPSPVSYSDVLAGTYLEGGLIPDYTLGFPSRYSKGNWRITPQPPFYEGIVPQLNVFAYKHNALIPTYREFMDAKIGKNASVLINLNNMMCPSGVTLLETYNQPYCYSHSVDTNNILPILSRHDYLRCPLGSNYISVSYTLPSVSTYPPDASETINLFNKVSCFTGTIEAQDLGLSLGLDITTPNQNVTGNFYDDGTFVPKHVIDTFTRSGQRVYCGTIKAERLADSIHATVAADNATSDLLAGDEIYIMYRHAVNNTMSLHYVFKARNIFERTVSYLNASDLPLLCTDGSSIPGDCLLAGGTTSITVYDTSLPSGVSTYNVTSLIVDRDRLYNTYHKAADINADAHYDNNLGSVSPEYCTLFQTETLKVTPRMKYNDYLVDTTSSGCSDTGGPKPNPCTGLTKTRLKAVLRDNQVLVAWSDGTQRNLKTKMLRTPTITDEDWTNTITIVTDFPSGAGGYGSWIECNDFGLVLHHSGRVYIEYNLTTLDGTGTHATAYKSYMDNFHNTGDAWSSPATADYFRLCSAVKDGIETFTYRNISAGGSTDVGGGLQYSVDNQGTAWHDSSDVDWLHRGWQQQIDVYEGRVPLDTIDYTFCALNYDKESSYAFYGSYCINISGVSGINGAYFNNELGVAVEGHWLSACTVNGIIDVQLVWDTVNDKHYVYGQELIGTGNAHRVDIPQSGLPAAMVSNGNALIVVYLDGGVPKHKWSNDLGVTWH